MQTLFHQGYIIADSEIPPCIKQQLKKSSFNEVDCHSRKLKQIIYVELGKFFA